MAYSRGDYYGGMGDYYGMGDPGIFSSIGHFLGKVAKTAIGIANPLLGGLIKVAQPGERFATIGSPYQPPSPSNMALAPLGPPAGMPFGPTLPGGGGIITQSPMGTPVSPAGIAMQVARARRSHPNKQTYVIRGGGTSRWGPGGQLQVIPKGTVAVPNRRMNVANPRALRRSLRRVAGFAKLTKRVRRAVSMAASAVGVHHRGKKTIRRR